MATALSQVPRRLRRKLPRSVGPFYGSAGALDGAVAAWRAKDYAGSGALRDISGLGAAHDLTNNGASFLPFTGEKYVYLPGLVNNQITCPAPVAPTDLDVRLTVEPDVWSGTTHNQTLASQWNGGAAWWFRLTTAGQLAVLVSLDGSTVSRTISTTIPFAGSGKMDLRFTRQASTGTITIYARAAGAGAWTVLQSAASVSGALYSPAGDIVLGRQRGDSNQNLTGKITAFEMLDGIDGSTLVSWSAEDMGQTGGDSGGVTWTIDRATSGRKAVLVDRPLFLFGTDDYMETPNHADLGPGMSDEFTAVAVFRRFGTPSAAQRILSMRSAVAGGWTISNTAVNAMEGYFQGVTSGADSASTSPSTILEGTTNVITAVKTASAIRARLNGADGTTDNALAAVGGYLSTNALMVGREPSGGIYADMEFMGAAIFRRALSDAEIASVGVALGAAA